jgi:hypothetical protein
MGRARKTVLVVRNSQGRSRQFTCVAEPHPRDSDPTTMARYGTSSRSVLSSFRATSIRALAVVSLVIAFVLTCIFAQDVRFAQVKRHTTT